MPIVLSLPKFFRQIIYPVRITSVAKNIYDFRLFAGISSIKSSVIGQEACLKIPLLEDQRSLRSSCRWATGLFYHTGFQKAPLTLCPAGVSCTKHQAKY